MDEMSVNKKSEEFIIRTRKTEEFFISTRKLGYEKFLIGTEEFLISTRKMNGPICKGESGCGRLGHGTPQPMTGNLKLPNAEGGEFPKRPRVVVGGRCEDRVLDGPASGKNGSKGRE